MTTDLLHCGRTERTNFLKASLLVNTTNSNGQSDNREMEHDYYKKEKVKGVLVGQSYENTDRENSLLWKIMASNRKRGEAMKRNGERVSNRRK